MSNFEKSLQRVLAYEGGNVDNPNDPGGRTSRGITQAAADRYADRHSIARFDVWKASDNTIKAIYREDYWNRFYGDEMPEGVALCIFDAAVNSGLGQTAKWVQRSLNIKADGDFGPATKAAILNCGNKYKLINDICDRRLAMLKALPTWKHFGKGWNRRITDVRVTSAALLQNTNSALTAPLTVVEPTPKAPVETKPKPVDPSLPVTASAVGSIGTVAASIAAGFKDQAENVVNQLSPLAATWPRIAQICAIITIISVIAGSYLAFKHKQHQAIVDGSAKD